MSQYGPIWMEKALQKLQQENTRLRQENAKLRQEWDQLLEALEKIVIHYRTRRKKEVENELNLRNVAR